MRQVAAALAIKRTVVLMLVAVASVPAASAAEFCVTCDEPAAHYKCVLPGPAADSANARLKLLCITELAKAGKHALCSVDRQQKTPCDGAVKQIALPDGVEFEPAPTPPATTAEPSPAPAATSPAESGRAAGEPAAAQTDIPKTQKPPETVKESLESGVQSTEKAIEDSGNAAADAAKATGSTLEKAGQAIGDAAKKTWTCIASLFGNC